MKYAISHANIVFPSGPEAIAAVQAMERAGFESVWTVEHVVIPRSFEHRYPETADGALPFAATTPIPDPLAWIAYVAAAAPTLKFGTGILIVPERNPLVTAKAAATIDSMCGGRLMLGVGVGWLREEFDALGVPFAHRGRRTEEAIAVMRGLWSEDEFSFDGDFYAFPPVVSSPKPFAARVPIHIGGYGERAARRAGRIGDGFFPGVRDPRALSELVSIVRRTAEDAGRDPDLIEVTARGSADPEHLRALARAGADRALLSARDFDPLQFEAELVRLGEEVLARAG